MDRSLRELRALGVEYVSIVTAWASKTVRSTTIGPQKGHTPKDATVQRMARQAHANRLKVMLFPMIDVLKRKPLEWRGTIKPKSWNAWWKSYRNFMLHYAKLARRARIEVLCVGSELVTTEPMRKRWIALIRDIRKVYRGKLLYSANWDHYAPVSFWDQVDLVGMTAYYTLTKRRDGSETEMVKSWIRVRDKLVKWARKVKRRIVFTEVGYPSLDGGAVNPWDYTQGTAVDLEEQRRAFSAFVKAWSGVPELQGVFFWNWYGKGGPTDTQYTVRGKPAAKVVKRWYKKLAKAP